MNFNRFLEQQIHVSISPVLLKSAILLEKILRNNKFECYLIGGSVRDLILEKKIHDLDFTTNATPQQVMALFSKTIPVGIKFGTIIVILHNNSFEVTTYRTESSYIDGRRPEKVFWGKSLQEDLVRRDFTINSLAYSFINNSLHDLVGGLQDIQKKALRTIGNPLERFSEDGLRPIRGYRFAAAFSLKIDPKIHEATQASLSIIASIAVERFYEEWKKTLLIQDKYFFWRSLYEQNIFQVFFPKTRYLKFYFQQKTLLSRLLTQSKIYSMDIYLGYFVYLDNLTFQNPLKSIRQNYKDISKDYIIRFPFLQNLFKQSLLLVCSPFFLLDTEHLTTIPKKEIRFILHQISKNDIKKHFRFFYNIQKNIHEINSKEILTVLKKVQEILIKQEPLYLKDLNISGSHIVNMGIQGSQIGLILNHLLQEVINENLENKQQILLKYIMHKYL